MLEAVFFVQGPDTRFSALGRNHGEKSCLVSGPLRKNPSIYIYIYIEIYTYISITWWSVCLGYLFGLLLRGVAVLWVDLP